MVLTGRVHADVFTFNFDSIPSGLTNHTITESSLTMSLFNPLGAGDNLIDVFGDGTTGGLTFDLQGGDFVDMYSLDVSFDDDVKITGYSIAPTGSANFTFSFGSDAGNSAVAGDHVLDIDLASGEALTILESTGANMAGGLSVIASITVETAAIPEPTGLIVLALGGIAVASRRRKV